MASTSASPLSREELLQENQLLREENAELKRLIFGSKKERFVPSQHNEQQLSLELEATQQPAASDPLIKQTVSYQRAMKQAAKATARQPFPAHLPRIEVVLEPQQDITGMRKIGEEITEELDLTPARLFVRRYIRPRYVSQNEEFYMAELPARPIEK